MSSSTSRTWTWRFAGPPDRIWPILSDTARINEAAGTPRYQMEEIAQPDGTVLRLARAKVGRWRVEWEEQPYEWVLGRRYNQVRVFRTGPLATLGPTLTLEPDGEGGTRATYTLSASPRNLAGRLLLAAGFVERGGRMIERLVREIGAFAAGQSEVPFDYHAPPLAPGAAARLAGMVVEIDATPYGHGLAARLARHIETAPELDLARIRPLALARAWAAAPRDVIEFALAAVKAGMLEMRWDLLCPRCRGAKETALGLDHLPRGAHCPSCNIDYERQFDRNIELTFTPALAIRPVAQGGFCLSGPGTTPHVVVQQILAPGERREVEATLAPGAYRLRTLEPGGEADIEYAGGGFPALTADGAGIAAGEAAPPGIIVMENSGSGPRTFVIESRDWVKDALTAHRLTTMQAFRDLFAGEAPRPGDEVGISQVTLLFTDLKGSTALYERVGDSAAYRLVRDHFAFLADAIRSRDGAIVKTIGDAVMAAFADPAQGVEAALAVQERIADFNRQHGGPAGGLIIKVGLHAGPCIAVRLNDRLDYFGSTVNLASRLQGESQGGDVVLSRALADDPAVAPVLAPYRLREESAALKGFDRPVPFLRLIPAEAGVSREDAKAPRRVG